MIRKSIKLMYILIAAITLSITRVNAAELEFGSPEKESNKAKVPVVLVAEENETIDEIKFSCNIGSLDATCEEAAATGIVKQGNIYANPNGYASGKTTIAYLTITNNLNAQLNGIALSLKGASINGVTKELSTTISLGAKPAEKANKSSNSKLKSVKFSSGKLSPEFDPNITNYTVHGIADTINSTTITYECENCDDDLPSSKITLNQGSNKITVKITSEDGSSTTPYTFNILRGDTGYNSPKLAKLEFEGYTLTPAFSKDVREYSLTIPNNINSLVNQVTYESEDPEANISVDGLDNFTVGENKITITVDNVNGDESYTYIIKVKRLADNEIEIIKYIDKEVTFKDAEGVETTLSENEFKEQYPSEYKKIKDGTYKFDKDGKIIIEKEKEEIVEKEEKKSNKKTIIIIVLVIVGIAIIAVSGFFIFKKKKPEDKDKTDKKNKSEKETNEDSDDTTNDEKKEESDESEEKKDKKKKIEDTTDIDEALSDLMSTKTYNFKDDEK